MPCPQDDDVGTGFLRGLVFILHHLSKEGREIRPSGRLGTLAQNENIWATGTPTIKIALVGSTQ